MEAISSFIVIYWSRYQQIFSKYVFGFPKKERNFRILFKNAPKKTTKSAKSIRNPVFLGQNLSCLDHILMYSLVDLKH